MKQFDRQTLKTLRSDIEAAMASISEKHSILIDVGNMRFSSSEVSFKATAKIPGDNPNSLPAADLEGLAASLGLWDKKDELAEILSKPFTTRKGEVIRVTGYNARRPQNCIQLATAGKPNCISGIGYLLQEHKALKELLKVHGAFHAIGGIQLK